MLMACAVACSQSEEQAIRKVLAQEVVSEGKSDVAGYMATVDPQSSEYAAAEQMMKSLFKRYKLKVKLDSFKLVSVKGSTAQVRVVISTYKVSGPAFRNNRITQLGSLVKRKGRWFITASKIDKIDYLD